MAYGCIPFAPLIEIVDVSFDALQIASSTRWMTHWVGWASKYGLQFRIEETNTLSLGGLAGASDRAGAALYFIDFPLAMAQVWCRRLAPPTTFYGLK